MMKNPNATQYGIVLVTAPDQSVAEAIAKTLVSEKLAACVNFTPIHSIYTWEGQLESAPEWQLVIKTDLSRFSTLETRIQQIHPYEVPEIIAIPLITGSKPYLEWISASLKP